jgi:ATP-dependent DNA helicase RecQ
MAETIRQILIKYWGFSDFRPMQEEIINSVLQGRDTLGLMPTGGGKSLTFQVPGLKMEGVAIVITPLIALMKDQVESLKRKGIKAGAVYSGMTLREIDITLDNCVYGDIKFLYVSPERLRTDIFVERLKRMKVSLLVVDEAHCISQWGYDFRPAYLQIAEIRELLPGVPVLAVTGTATSEVVDDIQEKLAFRQKNVFKLSFARENLIYAVISAEDKNRKLSQVVRRIKGSGIIYVRNRRKTKQIADWLNAGGIRAHFYHAGLSAELRDRKQNDWMRNRVQVMVATNAFGMGIDKPDVRYVIHFDIPDSPEAYYQEAGRGGRDGKIAYAVIIHDDNDVKNLKRNFEDSFPPIKSIKAVYDALGNYFQLAYGSGKDESFDFVLSDFIKMYNLQPLPAYSALKFLEKESYIFLSDSVNTPSKLFFAADKEEVYRYQVKNPKMGRLIDVLIRSYSGLFTDFVAIDETVIAQRLKTSPLAIENALKILQRHGLVDYVPRSGKPKIIFNTERLDSRDLIFSKNTYEKLKENAAKRLDAILRYIDNNTKCRNLVLMEYFGETDAKRCGKCDVCKARNKLALSEIEFDNIINSIKPALRQKEMSVGEITEKFPDINENHLVSVLRWLLDTEKITLKNNLYSWKRELF